ncbi:MAG: hypothetical protein IKU29_08850 [Parabacteroides sp.]|nr:hypothetical protein [Parabacteroides sp.]
MKKILVFLFVVLCSFSSFAQNNQRQGFDKEAYLAKRNAFIMAEMGLTPDEAAAFIPLCNELHQKMYEAGRKYRKLSRALKQNKNASDADYLEAINEAVEADIRVAELERDYYQKFKEVLSPKKLYKYKDAEKKFTKEYMKDNKRYKDKGKKR